MTAAVMKCGCTNAAQDKLYGAGKRVHNSMKNNEWRCTVCQKVKRA